MGVHHLLKLQSGCDSSFQFRGVIYGRSQCWWLGVIAPARDSTQCVSVGFWRHFQCSCLRVSNSVVWVFEHYFPGNRRWTLFLVYRHLPEKECVRLAHGIYTFHNEGGLLLCPWVPRLRVSNSVVRVIEHWTNRCRGFTRRHGVTELVFCAASCGSLSTVLTGAEFHTESRRHGAWVLCGASALDKTLHVITVITYEIDGQTCKNRQF